MQLLIFKDRYLKMSHECGGLLYYIFNIDIAFTDLILRLKQDNHLTNNADEKLKLNYLPLRYVFTITI